jgi:dihydropteroate synthase
LVYHPVVNLQWRIKDRTLPIGERTLVMGILNVTPDSFSDGGRYFSIDKALEHARQMIAEGADIIDIGGESTRPGSEGPISAEVEISRVLPVIESLVKWTNVPLSVDTTKSEVARVALDAGASIVNDVSALRFDFYIADVAARCGAGLVLMHSRGTPATMHRLPPVADIMEDVTSSLNASLKMAVRRGVAHANIVIDPGIGFGKTQQQNLQLLANMDLVIKSFPDLPILVGTSRKSFIGRLLTDSDGTPAPTEQRLSGSLATIAVAVMKGAHIVRVHDVKPTVDTVKVVHAIVASALDGPSRD